MRGILLVSGAGFWRSAREIPAMSSSSRSTRVLKVVLSYLLVAVPLGWGVSKSVQKSLPLFSGGAQPAAGATK
jgi:hypothetical protein